MKKHLLHIDDLTREDVHALIEKSQHFSQHGIQPLACNALIAPLFYEKSTRTAASFEIAAKKLDLDVLHFSLENSSTAKGESLFDTIETLIAMGIELIVMRHSQENLINQLAEKFGTHCTFINAGSGMHAHPTQALLDLFTLSQLNIPLDQIKLALVGDVQHSRVVRSLIRLFEKVGLHHYTLVSPPDFSLEDADKNKSFTSLEQGIQDADVVMTFRVQTERFKAHEALDLAAYQASYTLTEENLNACCPHARVMHPGPMNRDVELSSEVADGPRSLILKQVQNGVLMRAAILEKLIQA